SGTTPSAPIRLKLLNQDLYFVTGSDNIISVWRSEILEAREVTSFSLRYFFNTPKAAMKIYLTDDSGIGLQPHPSSTIPYKDRYYFHNRKTTVGFFSGPELKSNAYRFQDLLQSQILHLDIGHDWVEYPDLYLFVKELLTAPAIEALCGPELIGQTPSFAEDFWKLDSDIYYFFKCCPRFLMPQAWRNREILLTGIKKWHAYARENFQESLVEADGHDRIYGSPLMRSRQEYLSQVDSLDADALASQDLGLLYGRTENANSIPAVFWCIFQLLQRPIAFQTAREEIAASQSDSCVPGIPAMDIDSLCSKPLLQSAYAETLRLYTSLFALRSAAHEDFKLGDWLIPEGKLMAVDSRVAHMDKTIWNTGGATADDEGPYPLDHFWPERFLEFADDPTSGPLRCRTQKPKAATRDSPPVPNGNGPQFTMEGLAGAWMPFGGGIRQCPGRQFAKQEIILSFAIIATMFDIELRDDGKGNRVEPDMKYWGLGTLAPKQKVPFRMRRRL
ncbi:hypothetical protein MMC18_007606, partial [Xylographa bjoerkii]|nr:hypothetical protein [Xylographa bjoerkii]